MKKEYNIIGLDCANCALTLEKYLQKVKGVNNANINFSTNKLYLDIDDTDSRSTLKEINKTIKVVNPDVKISEEHNHNENIAVSDIILYVVGIIMGLIVIFVPMNIYLYWILLISSLLLLGYKTYRKAVIQLIHFRLDENTLILISIVGACALGESMEALMVIALYSFGKMLESKAVNFSRKSISALVNNQPEYAVVLRGEKEVKVKPEDVQINDIIIVKTGEKVPVDAQVLEGKCHIDKRHLTGESIPVAVKENDEIISGSIVLDGVLKLIATSQYKDSTVSKILNLVSDASNKKSKTETFISKFSSYYTIGVICLSILVWGITWAVLGNLSTAVYRGLIFLVVACPCAFAISVPLSYFSGIGRCSKQGILIKGSNFLDECSKLNTIFFDKTGTLTTGNFVVENVETYSKVNEKDLLEIAVAGEQNSLHPIAIAICKFYGKKSKLKIANYHEIVGKGIEFEIKKDKYFVGRSLNSKGFTQVDVLKNDKHIGSIYLQDEVKNNSAKSIERLKSLGVKTMMLTGDSKTIAKKVSNELRLDGYEAELLPEDKYKILENEKGKDKHSIGFVGDGINDAAAMKASDIGISVDTAADIAKESADIVLLEKDLTILEKGVVEGRKTFCNIMKYIKITISSNFGNMFSLLFAAMFLNGLEPMLPTQILILNMTYDFSQYMSP